LLGGLFTGELLADTESKEYLVPAEGEESRV
jgi:hypothetical protein